MLEPDVTLTDYFLALECALFCWLIAKKKPEHPSVAWESLPLLGALGIGALLGGTVHGFFPDPQDFWHRLLWRLALLSIGVVALSAWRLGSFLWGGKRWLRLAGHLAGIEFLGFTAYLLHVDDRFVVAVVNYLPAVLFLLTGFMVRYRREKDGNWCLGIWGLVLTFVAAATQQLRLGLHPAYFNHNAVYHAIQAVAIWLLFLAVRKKSSDCA